MGISQVHLHIEDLVLRGFPPGDYSGLGAAVERELARLLGERGVPAGLAGALNVARVDSGGFEVAAGTGAEALGSQVARAVYGGLAS